MNLYTDMCRKKWNRKLYSFFRPHAMEHMCCLFDLKVHITQCALITIWLVESVHLWCSIQYRKIYLWFKNKPNIRLQCVFFSFAITTLNLEKKIKIQKIILLNYKLEKLICNYLVFELCGLWKRTKAVYLAYFSYWSIK